MIIRIQGPCGIKRCEVRVPLRTFVPSQAQFGILLRTLQLTPFQSQVEPAQTMSDLVPLYVTQLSDGAQSVHFFRDPAMSTPVPSKSFQELGCKNGEM